MKKIIAYAARPDELADFERFSKALNIEVELVYSSLSSENIHLAKGYEAVSILGNCDASKENIATLSELGCKYLASRSAGFNNVDMEAVREHGIKFSNATYSVDCVSDYTVMLTLMAVRRMKKVMKRMENQDFSLNNIQGREMHNLTFGIVGTGRIGASTARKLAGFGGKIIAQDVFENEGLKEFVTYVSIDELLETADVIILHAPLLESTHHLLNEETFAKTKKGLIVINTSRGELIDTNALIKYLDNGHISTCGFDVLEGELGVFHQDHRNTRLTDHNLAYLMNHQDVIVSPHSAFYTDQAVSDMVEVALTSLTSFLETGESKYEIK
ncbi:D-isomer specific 2-hydroxyacid dehydrogenase family protein [Erysipelothrix urinaevulpis]|uniref:D-isomer specific 2-hydroxyacid dehydrogenase family protein n=1 Tax=Erysipelothrix urinaevulpis TaxID=2683717 RepID=UPI00135A1568|nr:D-isomer specific 2-hydroxyacid dehydrogenase family protein [Erysipelothrix urinaevulpis]